MSAEDNTSNPDDTGRSSRIRRRTVIGAAAWSVPVVTVVGAAPAFAAMSGVVLAKTSPTGNVTADQSTLTQEFKVMLTKNGNPLAGSVIFSVTGANGAPTAFLSFTPNPATTDNAGVATTNLSFGLPRPTTATTFTVLATYDDGTAPALTQSWNVAYSPTIPNIVVTRVGTGTGTGTLASSATAVFLDEFTTGGALIGSLALPTTVGTNKPLTLSGTATAEGLLSRSSNGKFLGLAGYSAAPGTAGPNGSINTSTAAAVNRVVARVAQGGANISGASVDTTTSWSDAFSTGSVRSATIADNGADVFAAGSNEGIRYGQVASTTSILVSPTSTNNRAIEIVNGQLYFSTGSGSRGIYQVATGLPTTTGQTSTRIVNTDNTTGTVTSSAYEFVFFDLSSAAAGPDTLYVADDATTVAAGGGIRKFSLVGGTWTANGSALLAAGVGARGLAGAIGLDGNVVLYATGTNSALYSIVDTAGFNSPIAITATSIATPATNTALRGVAFAPNA